MDTKLKHMIWSIIFFAVFIIGIIFIMQSGNIGERLEREYFSEGNTSSYIIDNTKVLMNTVRFLVLGSILSLISGYGFVRSLLKI